MSADSLLGVHMKTNGAKHSKLKELFFPQGTLPHNHEEAVPARVRRWTSVFWVACILSIEARKHWKNVHNAVSHGTKMPAKFFYSQLEKDALKAEKVEKLKAARQKNLEDTADVRKAEREQRDAAAQRKTVERAKVFFHITGCDCMLGRMP